MSNDDESLLAKIQVLLDAHHYDEFLLIVLVLLTRVVDEQKLQQVWSGNEDTFDTFCRKLRGKPQYLQLVCRLVARLEAGTVGTVLFQLLLNTLSERIQDEAPLADFDVDLILALNTSAKEQYVNELLDTLWQRLYQLRMGRAEKETLKEKEMLRVDTQTALKNTSLNGDWKLVHDTLDALLTTDEDLMTSLHQAVLATFMKHGMQTCASITIPSWYKAMVLWVTDKERRPPPSLLSQWQGVMLQCTEQLTVHFSKDLQELLLHSKSISTALIQLILFYIASSAPQNDPNLTALAWTTLAVMVEAFGFNWMMLPGSGSLGNATSLCTILRLATGEWRIQLGRVSVDEPSEGNTNIILDSCGRVIVAALHHVMHLAEKKKEKFQMQGAALLHLRGSLQDALHATVQYLCQQHSKEGPQAQAGRVLGGLLTEFDVWDGLPEGISTDETLQALSIALQSADENPSALMPCLVMVLASVEDVDYCVKFLDKYHLLGRTLVNFLVSFWNNLDTEDVSQCTAACQVAEMWYSLSTPPPSVTAPLRKAILRWIRKDVENTAPIESAMGSAVDCYVMLFGQNAVPSEREARVIERVLDICEAKKSSCRR